MTTASASGNETHVTLLERFRVLSERSGNTVGLASTPLDVTTREGPVHLALGPGGERKLLIPLGRRSRFPSIKNTRGLTAGDSSFEVSGRSMRFIDLTCGDETYLPVFSQTCVEILRRLQADHETVDAVERTVEEFRTFFTRPPLTEVTPEKAAGLLAELMVLEQLVDIDSGAVDTWTGPDGARHDFVHGRQAIEVKSTTRTQVNWMEISAIDQLQEPEDGSLLLQHTILETAEHGRFSVPDLVERLLGKVSDADAFRDRLRALDYTEDTAELWGQQHFNIYGSRLYRVDDEFPRLTPDRLTDGKLPAGVSHVRYRLDPSAIQAWVVQEDHIGDLYRSFLSRGQH